MRIAVKILSILIVVAVLVTIGLKREINKKDIVIESHLHTIDSLKADRTVDFNFKMDSISAKELTSEGHSRVDLSVQGYD